MALLATCVVLPDAASAHSLEADHHVLGDKRIPGQPDVQKKGKTTFRFIPAKGEYEVSRPGRPSSFFHGDFSPPSQALPIAASTGSGVKMPSQWHATPVCRTSGHRIKVVWSHRPGQLGAAAMVGWLTDLVGRVNWKIGSQSAFLVRPLDMAVDCNASGQINVYDVTSSSNNPGTLFGEVEQQLGLPAGSDSVKYLVWDSESNPTVRGIAEVLPDSSKSIFNANAYYSATAIVYSEASDTYVTVHELMHALGAAQATSPYATNGYHCVDGVDILCYEDYTGSAWGPYTESRCVISEGGETPPLLEAYLDPIDCKGDTYFNSAPPSGSWLAEHWNVGGPEDPFLVAPPKATSSEASAIKATSATLKGTANPEGTDSTYRFEYGPTASYGTIAPVPSGWAGSGGAPIPVSQTISGLQPGTIYHYRIAVTNSDGTSDYGEDKVFTTIPLPSATTEPASPIEPYGATFNATVNPNGYAASYQFVYGPTKSYGKSVPVSKKEIGSGTSPLKVSESIGGLAPNTEYHFRIDAYSAEGVSHGEDKSFVTPIPAPVVTSGAATGVEIGSATVNGTVNPKAFETTYQFQYGKTTSYAKSAPATPKAIGSGTEALAVSEPLKALEPNTTYHYRLTATNAGGTTKGEDKTFKTPRTIATPTFSAAYGTKGTGNGQFDSPRGVAIDSGGNVLVVDSGNDRVQKLNSKGEYVSKFGSSGTGDGQFSEPWGIAIDPEGDIWVADRKAKRIQQFNSKGEYVSKFSVSDGAPLGIAFDSKGNIWVVGGANTVRQYNQAGTLLTQFGSQGTGDGKLETPYGISLDAEGNIWVADSGNHRLQKFSPKGEFLGKFGSSGTGDGQFSESYGIGIDPEGDLLVTDAFQHRVQLIHPEGEFVTKFGTEGSGAGQFKEPTGVAVDSEGNIWIADSLNNRLQKWKEGAPAAVITRIASAVKRTEATLNGSINPQGKATSYQFEYGTTESFGKSIPAGPKSVGSGSSPVKVAEALNGLKYGTTYYYHVVATSEGSTTYGETRHFTTLPGPGAEAKWRIGGKTFAELGITEQTIQTTGSMKIEFPTLSGATFNCSTSGSGTLTSSGPTAVHITITCEPLPTGCKFNPFTVDVDGKFSSLHEPFAWIESTCISEIISLPNGTGSFEFGTEATKLNVTALHTTKMGLHPVIFSGSLYWSTVGLNEGKTLGVW
jgi:streptogramin lyase